MSIVQLDIRLRKQCDTNSSLYDSSCDAPTLISELAGKQVVHIACGSSHSAAVTSAGELYTWGRGSFGRLGLGTTEDQLTPALVSGGLAGCTVVDAACGSGDAHSMAVTDTGAVYSWGDGEYGKLGRGGSEGCKTPKLVEKLQGYDVVRVYCGGQFSAALTKGGAVYTW